MTAIALASTQAVRGPVPVTARTLACCAILVALSAAVFLHNAGSLPLGDPDESRCAMVVRNMIQSGDYLMPHLSDGMYWDKPAPFFWLAALGQALTGSVEMGGRLVAGLAGMLGVLATFFLARRLRGDFAGLIAGGVLATSFEYVFIARWYRMDMPCAAAMWAALCWFALHEFALGDKPRRPLRQWIGFYFFAGLAVLMKGPSGLALPVMVVVAYFILMGQWRRVLEMLSPAGLLVLAAVASPWYVAACVRHPEYFNEFFLHQNVARFAQSDYNPHTLYSVGYIGVLLGGLSPWVVYLPGAAIDSFPRRWRRRQDNPAALFLWTAVLVPLAFFMAAKTQIPNYILPVFGPLAVLLAIPIAKWAEAGERDNLYRHGARAMIGALPIMLACAAGGLWFIQRMDAGLVVPAVLVAVVMAAMAVLLRKGRRRAFMLTGLVAVALVYVAVAQWVLPKVYHEMSFADFGRAAAEYRRTEGPRLPPRLIAWSRFAYSVPLYAGVRSMPMLSYTKPTSAREIARLLARGDNVFLYTKAYGKSDVADMDELRECLRREMPPGDKRSLVEVARRGDFVLMTLEDKPRR